LYYRKDKTITAKTIVKPIFKTSPEHCKLFGAHCPLLQTAQDPFQQPQQSKVFRREESKQKSFGSKGMFIPAQVPVCGSQQHCQVGPRNWQYVQFTNAP